MTIDDPGWGGLIGDEEKLPPGAPAPPRPADPAGSLLPPEQSSEGALLPPDLKKIEPPSPVQNRRLTLILVIIAVALGVVGGGAAGVIVALSGHHTTTTTFGGGSSTTTSGGGSSEPALLSVVPSALSGHCQEEPGGAFVTSSVTDEIACAAQTVSGSAADIVGYARFANSAAVSSYFNGMLSLNGLTSGSGDCATVQLSASTSNGSYCEGGYADSDGNSGDEVVFQGSSFDVGGSQGSSTTFCQTNFPGSTGVSVVLWTSPSDDSFGFALDCTDTSSQFVDGMQSNLVHAAYVLND
jgi:hypothetical protein